ncbi:peptidase C14, caspase domain-containing protein [Mycena epipterygia]|nr:peptidase C14, caspase domain-containing protein [Mycena epipterygia]
MDRNERPENMEFTEPNPEAAMILRCPVYAVIVGINQYQSNCMRNLEGCENDAQTVKTFLTNRFHIPESQIILLLNANATREAILENFQTHLIDNSSIEKGDAIIIYFAGHGSRVKAPESWPSIDGKIETLVPYDERTKTPDGKVVHGIPDWTINVLLSRLAAEKGNNITVICDCCHSGGATRDNESVYRVRSVPTFEPLPENLDRTLRVALSGESYKCDMNSHVLLAACREQEKAYEATSDAGKPCGFFTDSLVKQLREIEPNRVTYAELVGRLPTLYDQNPQCEGTNKDRFLFDVECRASMA